MVAKHQLSHAIISLRRVDEAGAGAVSQATAENHRLLPAYSWPFLQAYTMYVGAVRHLAANVGVARRRHDRFRHSQTA